MNFIITGSEGLIGESLKKELDKFHTCVMEIDMRKGSNILNLDSIKLNPDTQQTDILFHLASHCKINEGTNNPELPHLNNCDGTFKVLEFARKNKIPKVVFFSSSRVLSKEENPYTASKKYGENLVRAYKECYGIDYLIIRPSTVYGPVHDITSRLMTIWCQNALKGIDLEIYGEINKTLDFTYITDFVDGVMILINNWNKTKNMAYNISGEEETNLTDLANLIIKQAESKSRIIYSWPEVAQPQNVKIDITDMRELGFNPKVKVEEGVKRLIKFYKEQNE